MNLSDITVLILTLNEESNIGRTLDALTEFPEVLVVDSGSTDGTVPIIVKRNNTRLLTRSFDNHANQWNFGLSNCNPERSFVLSLDADYRVTHEFVAELRRLNPAPHLNGYRVSFRYCIFGKPLKGSLYPPSIALFRRSEGRYLQTGHTQRLIVPGAVGEIHARIFHDDRKSLSRWISSQARYAHLEADYLLNKEPGDLRPSDRMRLALWPTPIAVFGYTLIVKRCMLDGWRGWFYVLQRVFVETLIALELLDRRFRNGEKEKGVRR